jgi:secreted trypsin-like serine protease
MRRALRALVAAAVLAGTAFGLGAIGVPAGAIANGEPVQPGQYRFSVKLTMTDVPRADGSTYDSACSGALIAHQWIVTAGHCFHNINGDHVSGPTPYTTTATVGAVDIPAPEGPTESPDQSTSHESTSHESTSGSIVPVVEVRQSPVNDLAIARLAWPVWGIHPLFLAKMVPIAGEELRLVGWGALDGVTAEPATHLQTGLFTVSSVSPTTVGVVGKSPSPSTSACLYDSGGPYFRQRLGRPELVSVESAGPDCAHDLEETTTRVDVVTEWILRQIR